MNQKLQSLDERLFLFLNGNHSEFADYAMLTVSNLLFYIPILLLAIILGAKHHKNRGEYHQTANFIMLSGALLFSLLLCFEVFPYLFSLLIEREKPCLNPNISNWVRLVGDNCMPGNVFFAIRPCIIFCITSFLLFTIKNDFMLFKIILILCSIIVSYSRIYLGVHYPFNVLISGGTGFLLGFMISRAYLYLKYNFLLL